MVLDPFSALGLASNVIQFVDFGGKLLSRATQLYQSVDGALAINTELETIVDDLSGISANLGITNAYQTRALSEDEKKLFELAESCQHLADELLLVLRRLKVQGPHRKYRSVRQALASTWKEKEISGYVTKLGEYRSQLTLHLITILSNQQSSVLKILNQLNERHQHFEVRSVNEPERLKADILAALKELSVEIVRQKDLTELNEKLVAFENEGTKLQTGLRILERLHFPSMESRHANIAVAHSSTFEWIFRHEPRDDVPKTFFLEWLVSQSGIYWINGKAGSGKSTLMKFLWEHQRTMEYLRIWSGDSVLVTASYFFWNSGIDMQKSQEGLLRSLLYSILQQCPSIMSILPSNGPYSRQVSWSLPELLSAFSLLRTHDTSTKFCFFIDGLDEYDGFHEDVIDMVKDLVVSPNIKICLSSRPWNVFEEAFGSNNDRKLRVQDFTREDIKLFVKCRLEDDRRFIRLEFRDKQYQDLVQEVVDKAQGVFLWVFLVVRSLLRGLVNFDTVSDLQRRLALLPSDLEKYYRYMLDSTEEVDHRQAAQILQTCLAADGPLSLITLSFFDEQDSDFAIKTEMRPWRKQDVEEICEMTQKRINARCTDLVEIMTSEASQAVSSYTVEFLHRTVKDFLETEEIRNLLSKRSDADFDADGYLCQAYLAQIKLIPSN